MNGNRRNCQDKSSNVRKAEEENQGICGPLEEENSHIDIAESV